MKAINVIISALLLISVMGGYSLLGAEAQSYPDMSVLISGPSDLGVNGSMEYTITISGGPAEISEGRWGYDAHLDVENGTGSPGIDVTSGNSTNNVFSINITAPGIEQTITLVVTGYSSNTSENISHVTEFEIKVVEPVVLSATVSNNGIVPVTGVPVVFYANNREVVSTEVDLQPGESKAVEVNWTSYGDADYTISVKVDPEGLFFNVDQADDSASKEVHVGDDGNVLVWIYGVILITVGVLTFLMVLSARKPQRPGTPAKWRK